MSVSVDTSPFEEVLEAFSQGKMVIIVDDQARENEGDIAVATEFLNESQLSFMMNEARGLICCVLGEKDTTRLSLGPQVRNNNSPFLTPFTVSVDAAEVQGQGASVSGRLQTMKQLINPESEASDFVSPGSVFPLRANSSGVLARKGQTEGAYDLARICKLPPSGVICEILNPDGSLAKGQQLLDFAKKHSLPITSIEDIAKYRVRHEILLRKVGEGKRVLEFGEAQVAIFHDDSDNKEHIALTVGEIDTGAPVLVRVHSECLTGDVFASRRCDCGPQLHDALQKMQASGGGILLYLRQEGRGIGLGNKLRAYALQDQGLDTVEANVHLGFEPDERDFAVAAKMLQSLGVSKVKLLTNNPAKLASLTDFDIEITERVPLTIPPDEFSKHYLETKKEKMGHLL